jgi:hypothetical protein
VFRSKYAGVSAATAESITTTFSASIATASIAPSETAA